MQGLTREANAVTVIGSKILACLHRYAWGLTSDTRYTSCLGSKYCLRLMCLKHWHACAGIREAEPDVRAFREASTVTANVCKNAGMFVQVYTRLDQWSRVHELSWRQVLPLLQHDPGGVGLRRWLLLLRRLARQHTCQPDLRKRVSHRYASAGENGRARKGSVVLKWFHSTCMMVNSGFFLRWFQSGLHPDMTLVVDWVLKNNYLSMLVTVTFC